MRIDRRRLLVGTLAALTAAARAGATTRGAASLARIDPLSPDWVRRAGDAVVQMPAGTGFCVGPEGLVLTNHHVLEMGAGRRTAVHRGRQLRFEVVHRAPAFDLAWVRLRDWPADGVPLELASGPAAVGSAVVSVGFGGGHTLRWSQGHLLRRERLGDVPIVVHSAQTWWGSSGSPLLDDRGRVVAVHFGWDEDRVVGGGLLAVEPFRAGPGPQ